MGKTSDWRKTKSYFPKLVFVLCLLLLALLVFSVAREYLKRMELDREIAKLEQELASLNFEKKGFLSSIESYQSGFFLEQEAREKLNFKKSGETVAVIPIAAPSVGVKTAENETIAGAAAPLSGAWANAALWWNYFFN
ncbi:septum formation initiator family protein [Candidatus Falkowbacteria bacterium]|nr:septum formation initiator family protein [Candidatus Falkowbacteria bacterium]